MKTTSIITTLLARVAMTLLLALTTFTGAWAMQFITDVVLIGGSKSEVNNLKAAYQSKGWTVIDKDLNDGCGSSSDYIYLLYKTADNFENSPNLTFITGFYLTNESGHLSEDRMINDLPYHLVPYDGGSHFKSVQGNLNSNCIPTSSDIHLYYTTAGLDSKEAIYGIYFSNNEWGDGVVGKNGDNAKGYDLNAGCGKLSAYIFMHCKSYKSNYWNIITSSDFSQCRITGFNESVKDSVKSVPAIINGAKVIDIYPSVNLSTISNLETIYFTDAFEPTEMLSAKNCKKLTNIDVVDNNGTVIRADELPNRITSIPAEAFANSTIKNLKMPNVTNIGNAAFLNCDSLESVTIGNKVTSIGESAFNSCSSLTSITIPDNVTSIKDSTFYHCVSLKSVTIPDNVTNIGDWAFEGCDGLKSVTISNGVTSIGESAFNSCSSLTSITIPDNVTSIGYEAFANCSSMKSVTIGKGINSFNRTAFHYDIALESIIVTSGNPTYDSRDNCNAIIEKATNTLIYGCKNTVIPNSVTSIGYEAFEQCTSLTSIDIPNSVTSIGTYAFSNCTGLTSIEIPNSVTSIGTYAFSNCTGLTSIEIPNSITTIEEYTFNACKGLTSVTLPNSITRIQNNAFQYCSSLPSIVIPKSVRHIGEDAFFICTGMTDVYCYANPDSLRWPENDCDDFIKEGGVTKCHVFNTEEWNNFRDTVNVEFVGDLVIDLPDNANNDAFLKSWNNRKVNMTLQGRTFFKEGLCNTLCLPFTVTDKNADVGGDLQSPTFAGTPFEGAMVMTLDNTSFSNGTLTLNFRNVRTIEAGKPYIIKWQPVNSNDGTAILSFSNPTFYDVTITSTTPKAISSNGAVTFKGCLSPVTLTANNRTKLYLGENNTLYYPSADVTINACRAWFQLASPITSIGDTNGDRGINVTDVTSLVNHILGTASSNFIIDNADVNNDGGINVTDVTSLVNIILNSNDNIYNVVVNIDGNTIIYNGSSNGDPKAGENHIWDE
ncbi:MAG: leucine-rich repeat protein [Prevotella sp.]|nr:leucine-rich repeat protein [Prevotella sp.]